MKKWFINLQSNYKIFIHFAMIIILVFVFPLCGLTSDFFMLLWFAGWILEIVFIVWHIKYKSPVSENNESTNANNTLIEISKHSNQETKKQVKQIKISSVNISEIKVKVNKVSQSKIDKYDLYGKIPVSVGTSFDSVTDNIYISTMVDVETKDGEIDYKDIKLGALPQKAIEELSKYLSYEFDNTYVGFDAELDVEESELIVSVPYNLSDSYLPIYSKIVGVTFEGRQEYLKSVYVRDLLYIKHKPTEEHPNSIQIIHATSGNMLGYINSELSESLVEHYGQNCEFYGVVVQKTGGNVSESIGCNIQIVRNTK